MLTPRGWWFLVLVLTVGAIGGMLYLRRNEPALWLASLALAAWMGAEWVRFAWQTQITARTLSVTRSVSHGGVPVRSLWTGQSYRIDVSLKSRRGRLSYTICDDRPAVGAVSEGSLRREGGIGPESPMTWAYDIQPEQPGVVRFEGVRVRISDLQGFFYSETFIRAPSELTALPLPVHAGKARRIDKRANLLPPPGVHRFRRPGTGSELLELREYRPGDPPRRIAWKLSARRDELIAREYESEVPMRCTMFVDGSSATRLGPPGRTALAALTRIAAGVSQIALANRDLVGLAVTTEADSEYTAPSRSPSRLVHILHSLTSAASLPAEPYGARLEDVWPTVLAVACEFYPDLMRPDVNRVPWWMPWFGARPTSRSEYGWASWAVARVLAPLSEEARTRTVARKRIAALLAVRYRLPPGVIAVLCEDDAEFTRWSSRLLAEHRVPVDCPATDHVPATAQATASVMHRTSRALIRAVSRGRDNELMVLMGEFVERADALDPLLATIRMARARHHHVLVIQAGPGPTRLAPPPPGADVQSMVAFAEWSRRERAWKKTRRAFGRLGVPMLPASDGDPTSLILHRLDQIRSLQGARPT